MGISRKTINIILFVTFIIFAVIQLNDPDPYIWFPLYALVAAICLFSNYKTIPKSILIIIIISLLIYAFYHFSLFLDYLKTDNKEEIFGEMVYEKPYLEGSREFLGLLIAAMGLTYQLKRK